MKKLILLLFIPLVFSCSDDEEIISEPNYSIEGKWLIEGTVPAGNTMYLYEDGVRYTYYCVEGDCTALYNSYEANDGNHLPSIPDFSAFFFNPAVAFSVIYCLRLCICFPILS